MKAAPFAYHDPASLDDLIGLLGTLEDVKLLAGGQSLMPMLNMRFSQPDHVIDLNGIPGLAGISVVGGTLTLGAMTRQSTLLNSPDIATKVPVMQEALRWVGHFQTRNRGTLGGSLCHLDPSAELPTTALLHDAHLSILGPGGERQVAMQEWPLAYMMPSIAEDEILTTVTISPWDTPSGHAYEEFARRHGDFAIVGVGVLLSVDNGSITRAAIAIAGAGQVPYRLKDAESALVGQPANEETFAAAAEIARSHEAMSDAYYTAVYRQRLAATLTKRALAKAAGRANGDTI